MLNRKLLLICLMVLIGVAVGACSKNEDNTNVSDYAGHKPSRQELIKDMVLVPAGEFIMGSNNVDKAGMKEQYGFVKPPFLDEHPEHKVTLGAYYLDKYEVSNAQYKRFLRATKRPEPFEWTQNGYNVYDEKLRAMNVEMLRHVAVDYFKLDMDTTKMNKEELLKALAEKQKFRDTLPAGGVSWYDAYSYCAWTGKRLPSESEWEKAARGPSGLEFPWGDKWDPNIANTGDNSEWDEGIAPIGSYEKSKSPYGAYDMAGNVWEWVDDWYKPYPGSDFKSAEFGEKNKVIRGGGGGIGHYSISVFYRGASRQYADPNMTSEDVGFRCALSAN